VRDQIFRESKEKGVSQFVFDPERRRMNEASLVANLNPEIEAISAAQRDRGKGAPSAEHGSPASSRSRDRNQLLQGEEASSEEKFCKLERIARISH
jgi:hypothetical protein